MADDQAITKGSCRCGQVRLRIRGRPAMTMACHCTGCQRMTASAFSLSALYPDDAFEVEGSAPVLGGLRQDLEHYHCPDCKSWLFTRFPAMGPFVNVRATMLDNARDFVPFMETQTAEKLAWVSTPAVHSFERFPPPDLWGAMIGEYAARSAG